MSESTRGIEVMGQAVAVALLLALTLGPAAAKEPATTAAVVVEAPAQGDAALARQIENLLTTTLDGQGIRRVRFGREDVSARETEIRKQIDDAFARVTAGMRSKPFDEGNEILNAAFFQAKQILGRIDPGLMARLYKAFAAAQVTLGRKDLGEDYVIASLNLDPEQSPRSFHYFSDMRWVVEAAHKRFKGKRHAVTLAAKPSSARIIVDGKDLGPGPVEIALASGPHLVQIQADGFHPQGWLKETDAEARWSFDLRPLPAWERYTSLRRKGASLLQLDRAERKAAQGGAGASSPRCPTDTLATLGRLVDAHHVLLASVESVGDRIAVRGCHRVDGIVTPFSLLLVRDATLLEKIRAAVEETLAVGRTVAAEKIAAAVKTERSAQDPLQRRLDAARQAVTGRLSGIADRERHHRALGLAAKNSRFRVVRGPLEALVTDLDEAARVYATDKVLCTRLVKGAEDRLGRMKDMLLSVDAWDPTEEARARDAAAVRRDHAAARQAVTEARGHWKKSRRAVKDREARKQLDRQGKALQRELKALDKALKKAGDPRPFSGRTLQLLIDAKGLRRAVDAALEPPPPPPPPPIIPAVEPEPASGPVPKGHESRTSGASSAQLGFKAPPTVEPASEAPPTVEPASEAPPTVEPDVEPLPEGVPEAGPVPKAVPVPLPEAIIDPIIPDVEPEPVIPEPDVEPEPEPEPESTLF